MNIAQIKEWIQSNIPMLAKLYDNKYASMLLDRFQSLPANVQRNAYLGGIGFFGLLILGYLGTLLFSLWQMSSELGSLKNKIQLCLRYQKTYESKAANLAAVSPNAYLDSFNAVKDALLMESRVAGISPRMIQVTPVDRTPALPFSQGPSEPPSEAARAHGKATQGEPASGPSIPKKSIAPSQVLVKLERVNLNQFKGFLQNVEFGKYRFTISSLHIANDDRIRGYMGADIVLDYFSRTDADSP